MARPPSDRRLSGAEPGRASRTLVLRQPQASATPASATSKPRKEKSPRSTTTVAPLTVHDAEALVTAARSASEAGGAAVSVTVLDAGGHLLAFRRDDRAGRVDLRETNTRKAYAALPLNARTADLVTPCSPAAPSTPSPALDRPLLFFAGGVPVRRDGRLIGAIEVGGGAPEQDRGIAMAAVETLV